jgi:hypothetical protein
MLMGVLVLSCNILESVMNYSPVHRHRRPVGAQLLTVGKGASLPLPYSLAPSPHYPVFPSSADRHERSSFLLRILLVHLEQFGNPNMSYEQKYW